MVRAVVLSQSDLDHIELTDLKALQKLLGENSCNSSK